MNRGLGAFLLTAISISAGLLIIELGLRLLTPYPNNLPRSNHVADPALGFRLRANSFGANSDGFRSAEGIKKARLVAIGDSHTFGVNAPIERSWPSILSSHMGISYFNFGVPGYNLRQYSTLLLRAFEMEPAIVIVAIYPYNDFEGFCGT